MRRGDAEHRRWEITRGRENECDAERRLADKAAAAGADMSQWWNQWFERSDEWRDEMSADYNVPKNQEPQGLLNP